MNRTFCYSSLAAFMLTALMGPAASAQELMGDSPWTFTPTSRASVAFFLRQESNAGNGSGGLSAGNASACGGGGTSTAMANFTCIIMNNSNGSIETAQDAVGNQTADAQSDTSIGGVTSGEEGLSNVLNSLLGAPN